MRVSEVAIVTGASSGLGLEIALLLQQRGVAVVGVSRRPPQDARWTAVHVAGDAASLETARRAIAAAAKAGDIRYLVNSAGIGVFGVAGTYDSEQIRDVIDANLIATITFCDAILPRFIQTGGTVVNVLSTAAMIGRQGESVYCAAKWGARGYTEAIRAETKGTAVRIIAVYPGGMNTPFWREERSSFMNAADVAAVIVDAMFRPPSIQVSDIVITRP